MRQIAFLALLVLVTALAGCKLADRQPRMAVINLRDAMTKSNSGIRAVEAVQQQFAERRNALKSQEDAIRKLRETPGINDPKFFKREELQRLLQEYAQASQELRKDVASAEAVQFKPVADKIHKTIGEYAKEHGLLSVQDKSGFAYIDPSIDITDEIIKRVDQTP
jgi:outer membrane protein